MPGTIIRTATRSGPSNAGVPLSGRYFCAALFERGPVGTPVRCRSLADVEANFGGRVTYGAGYDDLRTYFEEGGAEALVLRVVGPAATNPVLALKDSLGTINTLNITAVGASTVSTSTTIQVANGTIAGTYKLVIVAAGTGGGTETYDNLVTPLDAVTALRASKYARAADAASATAAPAAGVRGGNQPINLAATALTVGTDDRASVTATVMGAALSAFTADYGSGAVAAPGFPASTMDAALRAHAKANNRLALLALPQGTTDTAAASAAAALPTADGEFAGLFYPWVRIPVANGQSKLISPEGYVAAMRARAHRDLGAWAAPAGERAVASFVLEPELTLTTAQANALDDAGVSAIRAMAGTTRLYGWRSLSADLANYALLNGRDVLNHVAVLAGLRLEPYVFRTIDSKGQLLAEVAGTLKGLVEPMRQAGGLYEMTDGTGKLVDPGYSIDVGPSVNTVNSLATNTVKAVVALRVSPVGTLIDVTIVKAGLTANV